MTHEDHRVYSYLSAPIRILGFTLDELLVGFAGIVAFHMIANSMLKFCALILGIMGVFFLKKFKKMTAGFSWKSWAHWTFGWRFDLCQNWPHSAYKRWLP